MTRSPHLPPKDGLPVAVVWFCIGVVLAVAVMASQFS
jgi:hypothetical protein